MARTKQKEKARKKAVEISKHKSEDPAAKKERKTRRRKRVKSEIRKLQKHGDLLVSKAGFRREIIRALDSVNPDMLITSNAVKCLQAAAESALTDLFIDANRIATHNAKRVAPLECDIKTAVDLGHTHFKPY